MDDLLTTNRLSFCPAGAHLTSADSSLGEIFYLSSTTTHGEGNAIRGGVPIIAPWFGEILGKAPKHGWARISNWRVTADMVGIDASLEQDNISLRLHVAELPDGVRLELSATNEGSEAETIQLAFHPYFRVSHPEEVSVRGLDGARVQDRLTEKFSTQDGDVSVSGLFDRIFLSDTPREIVDPGLGRSIRITSEGADCTVVWNPGHDAAADMSDIGDGEWKDFLCVEPALLGEDFEGVELAPGDTARLSMEVTVASD